MKNEEKIIPITCHSFQLLEVESLNSIQGNLKTRTREKLHKLKSLIFKHGFSFPIFVWFDGEQYFTLDGHGRDYICKELISEGWQFEQKDGTIGTAVPCDLIDAASRIEAKEKLLALNSQLGDITEEGLYEFLFEPNYELNFVSVKDTLELPNIDLADFENDFLDDAGSEEEKDYKYVFTQEQLKQSIKDNFPKFESTAQLIEGIIDYPLAMHQFNKLCSGGKNIGVNISLLFNPHRLETKVNNRKKSTSEQFIDQDHGMISSLSQWMSKNQEVVHHRDYVNEARVGTGTQIAHEFKPYLARQIYLDYCSPGARVLDPCAGWGGRMIGFAASGLGGEYITTDPSTKTFQGLLKLKDFLMSADCIKPMHISLHNLPFEDLDLPADEYPGFDFAFTSPPYFDTEIYSSEETQAFNRYKTLEEFNEKFLTILIEKTMNSLKKGKCFLLNIGGSQYRFDKTINKICDGLDINIRETFDYKIGKGEHFTNKFQGDKLENTVKANDLFFEIRK